MWYMLVKKKARKKNDFFIIYKDGGLKEDCNMKNLKNNIIELMQERNMTAYALSKKADIKLTSLQNILYDKSKNPTINVLSEIAKALDCSLLDLVEDDNYIKTGNWDINLYCETTIEVSKLILEKRIKLDYHNFLNIVREIYTYLYENNNKKMDLNFCRWFLKNVN